MAAHYRSLRSVPVGIVTTIDHVLRGALTAGVMLDAVDVVELRYEVDVETSAMRRLVVGAGGVIEDALVELDHPCVSCAMREDAVPALNSLAADPRVEAVLLCPPISADPSIVAGTLAERQGAWHLASAVSVLAADAAIDDLLGEDTLAERGLQWAAEDERSVGEALAAQIEYSGLVVAEGSSEAGLELVEHLRAPDQLLATSLHELDAAAVIGGTLDHEAGLRRCDPRQVDSYGGPTVHGTWTLDLMSERPFHPHRLLENIEQLGSGRMRGRGRFWVPDRPGTICQWDGAGGQVSIGAMTDTGRYLPTTRLVVTGIDRDDAPRVREAFARSLLTPREWEQGLAPWLGADDPLAPWLGRRDAVH